MKVANNVVHSVCGQPYLSFKIFSLQMEPGVVSLMSGKKRKCELNHRTVPKKITEPLHEFANRNVKNRTTNSYLIFN